MRSIHNLLKVDHLSLYVALGKSLSTLWIYLVIDFDNLTIIRANGQPVMMLNSVSINIEIPKTFLVKFQLQAPSANAGLIRV